MFETLASKVKTVKDEKQVDSIVQLVLEALTSGVSNREVMLRWLDQLLFVSHVQEVVDSDLLSPTNEHFRYTRGTHIIELMSATHARASLKLSQKTANAFASLILGELDLSPIFVTQLPANLRRLFLWTSGASEPLGQQRAGAFAPHGATKLFFATSWERLLPFLGEPRVYNSQIIFASDTSSLCLDPFSGTLIRHYGGSLLKTDGGQTYLREGCEFSRLNGDGEKMWTIQTNDKQAVNSVQNAGTLVTLIFPDSILVLDSESGHQALKRTSNHIDARTFDGALCILTKTTNMMNIKLENLISGDVDQFEILGELTEHFWSSKRLVLCAGRTQTGPTQELYMMEFNEGRLLQFNIGTFEPIDCHFSESELNLLVIKDGRIHLFCLDVRLNQQRFFEVQVSDKLRAILHVTHSLIVVLSTEGTLIAFDKSTGMEKWHYHPEGREMIDLNEVVSIGGFIIVTSPRLAILELASGKEVFLKSEDLYHGAKVYQINQMDFLLWAHSCHLARISFKGFIGRLDA